MIFGFFRWTFQRLSLTLLLCGVQPAPCLSASPPSDAPAQALLRELSHFSTYAAHFSQKTYNEKKQLQQLSQGTMAIDRPGRFYWYTQSPNNQKVIANGKTLWIYDLDLAQAVKEKIDTSSQASPARLLSDNIENLSRQFSVKLLRNSQTEQQYELCPHAQDKNDFFQKAVLYFKKGILTRIQMVNALGETNDFEFSNIQLNTKLAPTLFQFTPMPGVDTINP